MASFLNKLFGRSGRHVGSHADVTVGAFGKHPGWDDHFDVGIETECLALVRQTIYVEGIAGSVDAGVWDRLPADRRLEAFNHAMLWHAPKGCPGASGGGEVTIAARLWSSRDGKGRDRYPMVLAAQCAGWPMALVAEAALPALARASETAKRLATSGEVAQLVRDVCGELRAALPPPPSMAAAPPRPAITEHALLVLIYHLERHAAAESCIHLRVPAAAAGVAESCVAWEAFVRRVLPRIARPLASKPILLLQAVDPWLDLIIGRPGRDDLFCIRANATALPLTTDIPYDLTVESIARARQILGAT